MSAEYSDMSDTRSKKRFKLNRFLGRLPYYFSYVILLSTWILFMLFVTLGEVLLKRREVGRFVEQFVIYNSLLFMTLISLATTANRSPGEPDQSLAPPIKQIPEDLPIDHTSHEPSSSSQTQNTQIYHREDTENQDDGDENIPLRYLMNSQWVNTRIGKDRPSPLPIPNNRKYLPSPPPSDRSSISTSSNITQDETESDSESEFSPFPLSAKSPFVPTTAVDAGEDDEDLLEDLRINHETEGLGDLGEDVSTSLLRSSTRTTAESYDHQGRSLMAKSNNGEIRWCKKCKGWKPDRCHHCRHCEQCVLKMDHHCPWVGTCVGYHNYKPFFLFINYALLLSIYATFEAGYETYRFFQDPSGAVPYRPVQLNGDEDATDAANIAASDEWSDGLGISPAVFMMLTIMGGFMSLSLGGLVIFHWYLTINNQTTLENITHSYPSALLDEIPKGAQWKADHLLTRSERNRLKWEAREINVYDLGWRKNLKNLFFGSDHRRISIIRMFGTLWPTGRPNKSDRRAGHFFAYNPRNFDKLRDLTLELRYGIIPEHKNAQESDFGDTHEASHSDGYDQGDGYELDRMQEKASRGNSKGNRVRWFEV
ncbi:uncharacterized protein L201_001958 [Kwoniella dendrophila CBS 6074]|uniref:Palmitoyltransferase n=1 Tax=Kwoniella dendrophila CBS 6074 TaxID=1295534 RepID=A0AAX4JQG0_9TREE